MCLHLLAPFPLRYYDQLCTIENKMPISEGQVGARLATSCSASIFRPQVTSSLHVTCSHEPRSLIRFASSSPGRMPSQRGAFSLARRTPVSSLSSLVLHCGVTPPCSLPPPGMVSSMYERCCVLFNVGSLQSQIAKSQNFESDDGLKNAAKHFAVSLLQSVPGFPSPPPSTPSSLPPSSSSPLPPLLPPLLPGCCGDISDAPGAGLCPSTDGSDL